MSLLDHLSAKLAAISAQSLTRKLRRADSGTAPRQIINGRELLMFCSNDYLGLAAEPAIASALAEGARLWGGGSGASPLVSGHSAAHEAVTETLARWYAPHIPQARAIGFCTGYMANLAVVTALGDEHTEIFSEQLNHASLIDAARLTRAKLVRFPHADVNRLQALLAQATKAPRLVLTDAVFSMDGDLAPLGALTRLAQQHGARLLVDDAHGLGVLGESGRGTFEHLDVKLAPPAILMGTLGKAFGTFGAFVAAEADLVETLIQQARTYIYTTALPPAVAEATRASLRIVQAESWRRAQLRDLVARFRRGARELGFVLGDSPTPIQPLVLGTAAAALAASQRLREQGILVPAIRPPTVAAGSARLRITFSATHTPAQVDRLLAALATLRRKP